MEKRGRKKGSKSEVTKKRIIHAAIEIAAERGYTATTTAMIAERAGVSEALIFKYFPSKQDLFVHINKEYGEQFLAKMEPVLKSMEDPVEKIKKLVDIHIEFFGEDKGLLMIWIGGDGGAYVEVEKIYNEVLGRYVEMVERVIREGCEMGLFKPLSPRMCAVAFIGIVQSILVHLFIRKEGWSEEKVREGMTSLALGGLLK